VNGTIKTYNIEDGEAKLLIAGRNPAWSPDGKWLGYQGPDGAPMLLDLATRKVEPLIKGIKCLWSVKWSPDARFAIFAQHDPAGTVFQVCRLRDRAMAKIYRSGAQYTEARFAWVTRSTIGALLAPGELVKDE
jgi:WD40 repeat protein